MSLINDPRLTAYALDEMTDAERAEFEALIASDAEATAEVESIRAMAGDLTSKLKDEPMPAERPMIVPISRIRWRAVAVAASVAVIALVGTLALNAGGRREVAISVDSSPTQPLAIDKSVLEVRQKALAQKLSRKDLPQIDPTNKGAGPTASTSKDDVWQQVSEPGMAANAVIVAGDPLTNLDSVLMAKKDAVRFYIESSLETASREAAAGNQIDAKRAIIKAQAARDSDPQSYTPAELADFDSKILAARESATKAEEANFQKSRLVPAGSEALTLNVSAPSRDSQQRLKDKIDELESSAVTAQDMYGAESRQLRAAEKNLAELKQLQASGGGFNTESYARIYDNPFLDAISNPLSTFSVDVDTASYSNVRRYLNQGTLPPPDAVRIEELINYFPTSDAPPTDGRPFAVHSEVASCPWAPTHQLVRVAIKGKEIANEQRPTSNLVFLIDVSGSMNEPNKLPLVKQSMQKLVDSLGENDRVAIAVYAGASGMALPSTNAMNKEQIRAAIDNLTPGGSTNGAQGIELAYSLAQSGFVTGGVNRVILCTDGDFNVGVTDRGQLTRLIEEKAKAGVFLSVLGFGTGNTKDDTMEQLADKGNGNYAYIDTQREADKVLGKELSGTLVTIAKDVKLQLEFNPAKVKSYRLIGYENRVLAKEDFNNDLKDAGEIGAGHHVVALYEVEPNRPLTEADRTRMQGDLARLKSEVEAIKAKVDSTTAAVRAGTDDGKTLVDLIRQQGEAERRWTLASQKLTGTNEKNPPVTAKPQAATDPLKYQTDPALSDRAKTGELLTLKLRYKAPDAPLEQGTSELIEFTLADSDRGIEHASKDFQFEASVAAFGMMLRDSPHKEDANLDMVTKLAEQGGGEDRDGYEAEFRRLVETARGLKH